jgi:hypothetical protein
LMCATALVAVLVAAVRGTSRLWRASATLSRSTLAGLAGFVATVEVVAGVPSMAVLAGCVVLTLAAAAVTAPRWLALALLVAGASVVLSDLNAPDRFGQPWPLYVLALLAALVAAQTLHPGMRATRTPTLVGTVAAFAVMAVYTARDRDFAVDVVERQLALEHHPLVLTVPTFVMSAVAAMLVSARVPIRAGVTMLVATCSLLLLTAPTADPVTLGGATVVSAVLTVLIGVVNRRLRGPATRPAGLEPGRV